MFLGTIGTLVHFIYQNYQLQKKVLQLAETPNNQTENNSPTASQQPTSINTQAPSPTTNPYPDWETYTNQEYGFEFSYPPEYEALDSENDLYGWPNAVVLLYQGGQAYDIPIEIWDNQSDYQGKYQNRLSELEVKQINSKYVTFLNNTDNQYFDEIINSFQEI